ncbi:O-antigen ligase family protein [Parabacteroides faecis]|uniref:O-antigen ligase family protein n=1 Tax=Parabacteroides TaxID=375288 RepID=UPI000EFF9F1B|nr:MULTISPECIES: O-antigen ligase family protein [Parabacteroides]MBC8619342.1 O-antigen ligase family protein [Parabacteroides faecis]RHR92847.1 hypothetical protein DWW23_23170 [Parabacteroides sp. AF14-59]
MENSKIQTKGDRIDYWVLIISLFLLTAVGYGFQIARFVLLILVAGYFIFKNLREITKFKILIPLILLLVLGARISTGYHMNYIIRDYAYFLCPITAFIVGYFAYKYISLRKFLLVTVLFGTIYSLIYFFQVTLEFNTLFVADTEDTRYTIGTGTPSPVLALVFVILGRQYLTDFKISNFYWFLFIVINSVTIYFFASRVYYFTLLLFLVPLLYYNFIKKYKRLGKYLFVVILVGLISVIIVLLNGNNFLAEKMRNSISEMFVQSFDDYDSVLYNWRAYELVEAIKAFTSADLFHKIVGFGFGKTVYLEYGLIMPSITLYDIPIFHNGFAYLLIKTGVIGLFLILLFNCIILYNGYIYLKANKELKFVFFLFFSSLLSLNFSMLVVNGFFSGESCYLIVLTGYTYSMLRNEYKKVNNENI